MLACPLDTYLSTHAARRHIDSMKANLGRPLSRGFSHMAYKNNDLLCAFVECEECMNDTSRLVSYQEYSLTHVSGLPSASAHELCLLTYLFRSTLR